MSVQAVVNNIISPNFLDAERKFELNLKRLSGATNAVTVDFMLETIVFINNNAVVEAQFIEEAYLGVIFDDDEFLARRFLCARYSA